MSKKLYQDAWLQLFAFTALLSGAMTVHQTLYARYRAPVLPDPAQAAAQAPAAPAAQAPAAPPAAPAPQPTLSVSGPSGGASPSLTGGGVHKLITPKTPGRWIVDSRLGPDADSAELGDVLFSAKDKDVIELRPGVYKGPLASTKKDVTIEGAGTREVSIEGTSMVTLGVSAGTLILKNLSILHSGPDYGNAIQASQARVELHGVRIEVKGKSAAVAVREGVLVAADSAFEGGDKGIEGREGSDLKVERSQFSGQTWGVTLDDKGTRGSLLAVKMNGVKYGVEARDQAEAEVADSFFDQGERAVGASKRAKLTLSGVQVTGSEYGVLISGPGVEARGKKLKLIGNKFGFQAWEQALGIIENSDLGQNRDTAVYAMDSGTVIKVSGSRLYGNKHGLGAYSSARIECRDCQLVDHSQNGATVGDSSSVLLEKSAILRSADNGIWAYKRGTVTLNSVEIRNGGDTGLALSDGCTAVLSFSTLAQNRGMGAALGRDSRIEASDSKFLDNGRCGATFIGETGTAKLSRTRMSGNECGIAFYEGGVVDSDDGDLTGNKKGAFMYQERNKSRITLRGTNNKTK